jgi:FkbM family methyltransferase
MRSPKLEIRGGEVMILEAKTLARSASRRVGLMPTLNRVRALWHRDEYEDKFAAALLESVAPDDCVWDIGANVGFYTEQLSTVAKWVVAFEPISANFRQIEFRNLKNVSCQQIALGDVATQMSMFESAQYSSLCSSPYVPDNAIRKTVSVVPGDSLTSLPQPSVVKIDVEGYELEVIRGMQNILTSVRAAFVEVHFAILENRGMLQAPSEIVTALGKLEFNAITWVDASHIMALKHA